MDKDQNEEQPGVRSKLKFVWKKILAPFIVGFLLVGVIISVIQLFVGFPWILGLVVFVVTCWAMGLLLLN